MLQGRLHRTLLVLVGAAQQPSRQFSPALQSLPVSLGPGLSRTGRERGVMRIGIVGVLAVVLAGCAPRGPQPTTAAPPPGRFAQIQGGSPVFNWPGSLALDTQTGKLCKT